MLIVLMLWLNGVGHSSYDLHQAFDMIVCYSVLMKVCQLKNVMINQHKLTAK